MKCIKYFMMQITSPDASVDLLFELCNLSLITLYLFMMTRSVSSWGLM